MTYLSKSSLLIFFAMTACGKEEPTDTGNDTGAPPLMDADQDGVALEDDCDDEDASLGAAAEDADCDGTLTADD